jgi:hypothetical protein
VNKYGISGFDFHFLAPASSRTTISHVRPFKLNSTAERHRLKNENLHQRTPARSDTYVVVRRAPAPLGFQSVAGASAGLIRRRRRRGGRENNARVRVRSIRRRRHLIQIEGETASLRLGAEERTGRRTAAGPAVGVVDWSKERTTGPITAHQDRTARNKHRPSNTSADRP